MANMTLITSVTVGSGGASSVTLPATGTIPQTYTDLKVVYSARTTSGSGYSQNLYFTFNNATSRYYEILLYSAGGSVGSVSKANVDPYFNWAALGQNAEANTWASGQFYIPNYTSSDAKSISSDYVSEGNNTAPWQMLNTGLWNPTSNVPITSIQLTSSAGNIQEGSTFYLYGIQNVTTAAKATGGTVTSDGAYFYHTFLSSGTFTPTTSLTCDYLVVAGGGGGGGAIGGGGGAGGLRSTVTATGGGGSLETALSLTAQAYTVTVGAGGIKGGASNYSNGNNSVFSTITAIGGGVGGDSGTYAHAAGSGGSGGGSGYTGSGGSATPSGQGYAGGSSNHGGVAEYACGGGGGAGAVGQTTPNSNTGGAGGNGVAVAITGSSVYYAGGGGGGLRNGSSYGAGGAGGGGSAPSNNGTANTGGGGGGAVANDYTGGGNGGSGIVIIRYAI